MNEIAPRPPGTSTREYRRVAGWEAVRQGYMQYLADESRLTAEHVEAIHFPRTAEEVAAAVRDAADEGHHVAVSGARTGIAGAAVPIGSEQIVSLEQLKFTPTVERGRDGQWIVHVGAATTLAELADMLDHGRCEYPDGRPDAPLYYPVDSTEVSAQIGGTIATNASGARTLYYGPTRDWVNWLKIVTADGRILELRRGEVRADGDMFLFRRDDGTDAALRIPDLRLPSTKHVAGYYLKHNMDAIDLFIGGEGTLGIICEAELRLARKPPNHLYLTQFVDGPESAMTFARACKEHTELRPLALEYMGPRALSLLRSKGRQTPAYVEVSRLPEHAGAGVYAELPFRDEDELDAIYAALQGTLESSGLSPDQSWAGFAGKDLEEMKRLRHAIPETVNSIIGQHKRDIPGLHKVGTDMAVPDDALAEMMDYYHRRTEQAQLEFVVFGHIGNGHVHVNMLPRNAEELARARELYVDFARKAASLGGSVAAEHGIGRIKKAFMPIQFEEADLEAMRAVKRTLDPEGTLNPGVLLDP